VAKPIKVVVQQTEAIELTSGWLDLEKAGPDVVHLLPVRYKQIGLHHHLIPVGEFTGALGLAVKLLRLPKLRKREG